MPDPIPPNPNPDQKQVLNAVSFFEQMLQTMPDDRVSMEVLAQAYEQAGDPIRARDLLLRLAHIAEREQDRDTATALYERLAPFAGNAETDEVRQRLARFVSTKPKAPSPKPAAPSIPLAGDALRFINGPAERRAIVTQEIDLAWLLHEQKLLTEDQYASIVSDITELSASATPLPISVLHLFQDRQIPNIDRVLAFIAEKSSVPLLPLSSFDPQPAAFRLLPLDYLIVRGVIPFEQMSLDLLVAALNPISANLREEVESLTGRRCHFFLVQPSEFDTTLDRIRKHLAGLDAPAKPEAARGKKG